MEDPDDLHALETFLREEGKWILRECGNPDGIHPVERQLNNQDHADAVGALVEACSKPIEDTHLKIVQSAMQEGREEEVRDELHAAALEALQDVAAQFDAHPGPSNAVEAEVLNELIEWHEWNMASIKSAFFYWGFYENGTARTELQLRAVYMNLIGPKADSISIGMILERYPWKNTLCSVPNLDELYGRVENKFINAKEIAEKNANERDRYRNMWQGRIESTLLPRFEYYREHNWWVGTLSLEVRVEMVIAYWENRSQAPAWPTLEEAEYLAAAYRNHTRTIWTEYVFDGFLWYFDDELEQSIKDWGTYSGTTSGAAAFMGQMAMRWPYADLECPDGT